MVIFQLTPSRRATILSRIVERKWKDFNSRPHGGRLQCNRIFFSHGKISTHALTEGDCNATEFSFRTEKFQLTPSRRATQPVFLPHIRVFHFNSRPHGGRPLVETSLTTMQTFQLTPSRRATLRDVDKLEVQEFQLTPSRRATHSDLHSLDFLIYFNSRPHGGRQNGSRTP